MPVKNLHKKLALGFITFIVSTQLSFAQNWNLVWSDEFTTTIGPDWVFEVGGGGWGNNELEYYRKENATIENGALVMNIKKESFGGSNYTSCRMKTQGKKSWKYGKMEARISTPSIQGIWPAFWMLGDQITNVGWPKCGEIDIMEHWNTGNSNAGTIHWNSDQNTHSQYGNSVQVNNINNYHIYTVIWDAKQIVWYVDNVQFSAANIENGVNSTSEFAANFFILLNIAIGGDLPGNTINDAALPNSMKVDYVRVYQDGPAPVIGTGNGLAANYFNGMNFEKVNNAQIDPAINFNWGIGAPNTFTTIDQFSTRWIGQIQPKYTGLHTFTINSDNGRRVWINNVLIIDKWLEDYNVDYTGQITLTAGQKYDIKVEYFENNQDANCVLSWSAPNLAKEVIPTTQLYANTTPTVSISSPANNTNFATGTIVTVNAAAADANGTVAKVDFYNGAALVGSDATSPFSYTFNNTANGTYAITATATDNLGTISNYSAKTTFVVSTPTSSDDQLLNSKIITTNPVDNTIEVISDIDLSHAEVSIFDTHGRQLNTPEKHNNNISVANLNPGAYILQIHTGDSNYTQKFIKK